MSLWSKIAGITGASFSLNRGGKEVVELSADPSAGAGVAAPVGSIGLRDNGGSGEIWKKAGSSDTAWEKIQATGGGSNYYFMTFAASETLSNSGEQDYLYYTRGPGPSSLDEKSGKNNGVQYADRPSPAHVPVSGKIKRAVLTLRAAGTGQGSVSYPCACQFDLNSQRWTSDGTKIGDIDFSIPSGYTIGIYGAVATNYSGSVDLDISITAGDLVGLKYIRGNSSGQTRDIFHAYVTLIIEET